MVREGLRRKKNRKNCALSSFFMLQEKLPNKMAGRSRGLDLLCFPSELRIQAHLPGFTPVRLPYRIRVEKGNHLAFLKHLNHLQDVKFLQLVNVFLPLPLLFLLLRHLT